MYFISLLIMQEAFCGRNHQIKCFLEHQDWNHDLGPVQHVGGLVNIGEPQTPSTAGGPKGEDPPRGLCSIYLSYGLLMSNNKTLHFHLGIIQKATQSHLQLVEQ